MSKWSWLLALVAVACSAAEEEAPMAGESEEIVGGQETLDVPAIGYLAHALLVEGRVIVLSPYCTGTLIAEDIVLTAAHCIEEAREKGYDLHFGTGSTRAPKVLVRAKQAVMHPGYLPRQRSEMFDVAYVVLEAPIADVPIATVRREPHEAGCDYVATGYGMNQDGYRYGDPILADLGVRKALSVCADEGYVVSMSLVTNGTIRVFSEGGTPCVGDSGGPLRLNDTREIVGVLSNLGPERGELRCKAGIDTYYAPLARVLPFIDQALSKSASR